MNEEEKVRGKSCQRHKSLQIFQAWGRDVFGVMEMQWGTLHSQAPRGAGGRKLWIPGCVGYLSICGQKGIGCLAIIVDTSVDVRDVYRLVVMSHSGSSIFPITPTLTSLGVW